MAPELHGCQPTAAVIDCLEFLEFAKAAHRPVHLGNPRLELSEHTRLSVLAVQCQQLGKYRSAGECHYIDAVARVLHGGIPGGASR